jgi:hypothetical protein
MSYSGTRLTQNELYSLFPTSENKSLSWDTLGFGNTTRKSTGKPEKSRCLVVHLAVVQAAERTLVKSGLPTKLRSVGKKLVPVALPLNSITIPTTLTIPKTPIIPKMTRKV